MSTEDLAKMEQAIRDNLNDYKGILFFIFIKAIYALKKDDLKKSLWILQFKSMLDKLLNMKGKYGEELLPGTEVKRFHNELQELGQKLKMDVYFLYEKNIDDLSALKTTDFIPLEKIIDEAKMNWRLVARRCPKQLWEEF